MRRFRSIPAWAVVLTTAAVVGAVSASVSVMGLAWYRNRDAPPIEVPINDVETVDDGVGQVVDVEAVEGGSDT